MFAYRVRFHPFTTNELPRLLATVNDYVNLTRLNRPVGSGCCCGPPVGTVVREPRQTGWPVIRHFRRRDGAHAVGGLCVNDYADRSFDPHVKRTGGGRWPPDGSRRSRRWCCSRVVLTALGLALQLNKLTLLLAVAGAALAVTYRSSSDSCRSRSSNLGVTFGWGIRWPFAAQLENPAAAGRLAAAARQRPVGHRLRHDLRDGWIATTT